MVAVKAQQADAFLKRPDRAIIAYLFYGNDASLVAERASQLGRALAAAETDSEILRLDDEALAADPDRLAVELQMVPMFGGRKIVRAQAGRRIDSRMLEPLLGRGALEGILIVEAGNLTPTSDLRKLFEGLPNAAAVACYAEEVADLAGLARSLFRDQGRDADGATIETLCQRIGPDRALLRAEIEKLALFTEGRQRVTVEDVEALVGDAADLVLDRVANAAARADVAEALAELGRADASGESPQSVIAALQRHFLRLHRIRAQVDRGQPLDAVLRQQRPPVHFKQVPLIQAQCRTWTLPQLTQALRLIDEAALKARLGANLEQAFAERLVMELGRLPAAATRGR